jgi:hypothetical protein
MAGKWAPFREIALYRGGEWSRIDTPPYGGGGPGGQFLASSSRFDLFDFVQISLAIFLSLCRRLSNKDAERCSVRYPSVTLQ